MSEQKRFLIMNRSASDLVDITDLLLRLTVLGLTLTYHMKLIMSALIPTGTQRVKFLRLQVGKVLLLVSLRFSAKYPTLVEVHTFLGHEFLLYSRSYC